MQALTKVYIGFLENGVPELVQELVDFHSDSVDPKFLTVSTNWIEDLLSEEPLQKMSSHLSGPVVVSVHP